MAKGLAMLWVNDSAEKVKKGEKVGEDVICDNAGNTEAFNYVSQTGRGTGYTDGNQ